MPTNKSIVTVMVGESPSLTLEEFCHAIQSDADTIFEMVEYELIFPEGNEPEQWRFDSAALRRGRIAASFCRDLEVNMPGVALALELLDKIEELERRVKLFERENSLP